MEPKIVQKDQITLVEMVSYLKLRQPLSEDSEVHLLPAINGR